MSSLMSSSTFCREGGGRSSRSAPVTTTALLILCIAILLFSSLSASTRTLKLYGTHVNDAFQMAYVSAVDAVGAISLLNQTNTDTILSSQAVIATGSTMQKFPIGIPPQVLRPDVQDFERQPGVVIVTKIHGPEYMVLLRQQYCLFTAAYNWKMQYDMVLFATEPIPEADQKELQDIVHPAKLAIYVDDKTLQDHIGELDANQTAYLLERCPDVNTTDQLTWRHRCWEHGMRGVMPLAYTWQCEFRSKWIWNHPGLAQYRYMVWMDSDAMCGKAWKQDPVAAMVRNDLVLLYDNYPQGVARGWMIQDRIQRAFNNKTLCGIAQVDGHMEPQYGDCWDDTAIGGVHGFFHITNLDFFRSPPAYKWVDTLIGDSKFSRKFDDQIAVAVAPAILAPNRSWDMWAHGINLTVFHNGFLDGKKKWIGGRFKKYWSRVGESEFPEAYGKCTITQGG